jgi:hypothetical protein
MRALKSMSKCEIEILQTYESTLGDCFNIEQRILSEHAGSRVYRRWSTELFEIDVLNGKNVKDFS